MNTYLIAVYDGETPYIESITARNLNDAKDSNIQKYTFEDDDILDDWYDFVKYMEENRVLVVDFRIITKNKVQIKVRDYIRFIDTKDIGLVCSNILLEIPE